MTNQFKSTTTALELLKAGWRLGTPDGEFDIYQGADGDLIVRLITGEYYSYPLTAAGLQQAAERVNLPF